MNRLTKEKRVQVIAALVEGCSIRSTVRMTGVAKNTVAKLLRDVGEACDEYQHETLQQLCCKRVQIDEIWSFCYAKEKNVPEAHQGEFGYGDVWTWTAIDADSKLAISWVVGRRDAEYARAFLLDVAARLAGRVQLTTDGHKPYWEAVYNAFGRNVDYAQLVKMFGADSKRKTAEARYSPGSVVSCEQRPMFGDPDPAHISTSYIERQNLTMRMGMRRFTRLTNAFSKKIGQLQAAVALHFMHYNFCRKHMTLKTTPAVAAGVADHEWGIEEIVGLLERHEQPN